MISQEEYYDFVSSIAGITEDELASYKCGGKTKKKIKCGEDGVKLKKESSSFNSKTGNTTVTRQWSDGTTSKKIQDDDGAGTTYVGRRGETATVTPMGRNAKADSLRKADWNKKVAPKK